MNVLAMVMNIWENSRIIDHKVKVFIDGLMEISMKVSGLKVKDMDVGNG